jgi:hypothetical protein
MSLIGVDWGWDRLEELIEARGERVTIETSVACTCRNGDLYASLILKDGKPANQRILDCPTCMGDSFLYRNARQISGLVTSLDPGRNRQLIEMGYAIPGDVVFSPSLRAGVVTDFDKVTFCFTSPVTDGQVIMRGSHTLENNAEYVTDLETNEDRLWYRPGCSIWCEDRDGVVYSQGADFVFEGKKLQWVGNMPDIGTLFTIKYTGYVEWVAYSTPFQRMDRDRSLGQRVMLRKKHITFTADSPLDSPSNRAASEIAFTTRTSL